ncbi:MAG: hypothetical protein JNM79_05200 [Burkholderiales bacterium]|nr:hypothetical protein [Burkholderiales bacterium]
MTSKHTPNAESDHVSHSHAVRILGAPSSHLPTDFKPTKIEIRSSEPPSRLDAPGTKSGSSSTEPSEILYPHAFDENEEIGQSLKLLSLARQDIEVALDAFSSANFEEVGTRLSCVSVTIAKAYEISQAHKEFRTILAFIRRAVLFASPTEISRSALNELATSLAFLSTKPFLDLDEIADLSERLIREGLVGSHPVSNEVLKALLDEIPADTAKQLGLFA